MYSAPSVTYPVGPSLVARQWLLAVWGAGVCCTAALALGPAGVVEWRLAVLAAGLAVAGLGAWMTLRRLGVGDLSFEDQVWSLSGDRTVFDARVRIALDLQHAMLLLLRGRGERERWIWVERMDGATPWLDLRRAVHSAVPFDASAAGLGAESDEHRPPVSAA